MKVWELKKWDKLDTWDMVYEFIKMDWMYWQWLDWEWNIRIWHNEDYEFNNRTKMYE